jgi:hypothetical protein
VRNFNNLHRISGCRDSSWNRKRGGRILVCWRPERGCRRCAPYDWNGYISGNWGCYWNISPVLICEDPYPMFVIVQCRSLVNPFEQGQPIAYELQNSPTATSRSRRLSSACSHLEAPGGVPDEIRWTNHQNLSPGPRWK